MNDFTKSIWIDAPPEIVFEYFIDPDKMSRWCGSSADLDPVPAGIYRLDMGQWGVVEGKFVRVEPPNFISHTVPTGRDSDSTESLIEVSITPDAGGSRVQIRQTNLDPPMDKVARRGWEHHLARLSVAATGGAPGPDPLCARDIKSFGE